jgi:hypothetical protein
MTLTQDQFRALAMAQSGVAEAPNKGGALFHVDGTGFAGLTAEGTAVLHLVPARAEQAMQWSDAFTPFEGAEGWIKVDLEAVDLALVADFVSIAWAGVAPKPMADLAKLLKTPE